MDGGLRDAWSALADLAGSPRTLRVFVVACLLLLPLVQVSHAVNPLDDDAGSGGDAGDHPGMALPIGPGSYEGRLTNPMDTEDHYAFTAEEGEVVEVRLGPEEAPLGVSLLDPDGTPHVWNRPPFLDTWLLIPETGTWTLKIVGEMDGLLSTLAYGFELGVSEAYHTLVRDLQGGWYTAEVAVTTPGDTFAYIQGPRTVGPSGAYANYGAIEYNLTKPGGGGKAGSHLHASSSAGFGEAAVVDAWERLPSSQRDLVWGTVEPRPWQLLEGFEQLSGTWRVSAFEGPVGHGMRVVIASQSPLEVQEASGLEIETWNGGAHQGGTLQGPGLSASGPRNTSVQIDHTLRGFFVRYDQAGTITDPAGLCHEVEDIGTAFLDDRSGTWRFGLGAGAAIGLTNRTYVAVADMPEMGVFEPHPWVADGLRVDGPPCGSGEPSSPPGAS